MPDDGAFAPSFGRTGLGREIEDYRQSAKSCPRYQDLAIHLQPTRNCPADPVHGLSTAIRFMPMTVAALSLTDLGACDILQIDLFLLSGDEKTRCIESKTGSTPTSRAGIS
ncbi:MAG: hypothetical protein HKN65_11630 [Woeseiaceae bacterium]|nr:hypothetical protein [Woeseiaceae bacterium]